MPLVQLRRLLCSWILLAAVLTGGVEGGLTQKQISSILGSPPDLTWTLTGPLADQWVITRDVYYLEPYSTDHHQLLYLDNIEGGSTHAVETTVTGPGVVALETGRTASFEVVIKIDGVQEGIEEGWGAGNYRVPVETGTHVVRWEFTRRGFDQGPEFRGLALEGATWDPIVQVPLSEAAADDGVTVTSPGGDPWIGQNAWHSNQNGAAWSGLKSAAAAEEAPLRADFSGPGIFSYRYLIRGGRASKQLDSEAASDWNHRIGTWSFDWQRVPEGAHAMEWRLVYNPESGESRPLPIDMVVDEIRLSQEIPLATALDTPGWTWTVMGESDVPPQAAGIPDENASGGSFAAFGASTRIYAEVPGNRIVKIRYRGTPPRVSFNGVEIEEPLVPDRDAEDWTEMSCALPGLGVESGRLTLTVNASRQIDRVEFLAKPGSLDAAFGLAPGTIRKGGKGPWPILAYGETGSYGARITAEYGEGPSWLELPVTGPAIVDFRLKTEEDWRSDPSLLVDGEELGSQAFYTGAVSIAIPPGKHVIRWQTEASEDDWYRQQQAVVLGGVKITPVSKGASALEALGVSRPMLIPSGWSVSKRIGRAGASVFQAPPAHSGINSGYYGNRIRMQLDGPGELSFWWHGEKPVGGNEPTRWTLSNLTGEGELLKRPNEDGWRRETVRIPAGSALLEWDFGGDVQGVATAALDDIEFTPAKGVSLAEALDAAKLDWKNNSPKPWKGVMQKGYDGDVALSPKLSPGETSSFSTVVMGPGKLLFHWREDNPGSLIHKFTVNGMEVDPYQERLIVPVSELVKLEWSVTAVDKNSRVIGVDRVRWDPWRASANVPLAKSLDTPSSVKWTTSGKLPFTGRIDGGAKNGSCAFIAAKWGERSWLEATVDGPGQFDFWLREAGFDLLNSLWDHWSVTVDGKPYRIFGSEWPAIRVKGEGQHKIRFTFRNKKSSGLPWVSCAMDDVSWTPTKGNAAGQSVAAKAAVKKWVGSKIAMAASPPAGMDSDGDGASDLLEMAFFSDPSSGNSLPPALQVDVSLDEEGGPRHALRIPYLSPEVSGVLQSSKDMIHWEKEETELLHQSEVFPASTQGGDGPARYTVPLTERDGTRFYRIWISSEPEAE